MTQPTPHLLPDERLDTVNDDIRLISKRQGLTYGTDAFLLAAFIRPEPNARAVELGGGTGIISLLLAGRGKADRVLSVELQPAFASLIERNAALNGLSDRVRTLCRDVRDLTPADTDGEVDLVFSNPPYMRVDAGRRNERDEKYMARHEVAGTIADFCAAAARVLRYGGRFATVWRPDRLPELMYALHGAGLESKRMTLVCADADTEPCMVLTEAVKGGSPVGLRTGAPLLLYEPRDPSTPTRTLTPRAKRIYDTCSFL